MKQLDNILYRVKKPARYTGGEWNSIQKDWDKTPVRIALIYPDLYEIGMSNMAIPILYELLNNQPDVLAERAYAPWVDMAAEMRAADIPLFSLESGHPLREFDILGFSLGYELTYTNVLDMLDLAKIPVLASERDDSHPLVIAGGSCALNPEPMADFVDLFVLGDGEEVVLELVDSFRNWRQRGISRGELLRRAATIPGIYVPGLYQVEYQPDGLIKSVSPRVPEAKPSVQRRIVSKLPPPVTKPVVPYIEVVHDRGMIEIQRGCTHGCRFCQASVIYRPVRVRPQEEILQAVEDIIASTGYTEVSLVSLSTSDYPDIDELVSGIRRRYPNLALSLPSLYIDSFSLELMDSLSLYKKTGLTFAPEAGSEKLRQGINKNISEEGLLEIAGSAFDRGWTGLKLYFMLGLPGETRDDIEGIVNLVDKVRSVGRQTKGRTPQIRITLSTFVPKPHTPFQWQAQESGESIQAKHELLKSGLSRKGIKFSWRDPETSLLETVLSRGDRRLGQVIYRAWQLGCVFDSWSEHFNYQKWLEAFKEAGLDPGFYAWRQRSLDEILPWSHIDVGVSTNFLKREYQRSLQGKLTRDCRKEACLACGLENWQPACQQKLAEAKKSSLTAAKS
ncbi:MAG: TIGR03960 family B12-binding radical SAM protein [Dehalococcoidales bacterium]|nr:TIGR03960 family B12-binding radical SAM protein [Dehalococcoidales bacterium]